MRFKDSLPMTFEDRVHGFHFAAANIDDAKHFYVRLNRAKTIFIMQIVLLIM